MKKKKENLETVLWSDGDLSRNMKEEYLEEWAQAIRKYVKTGVRTQQIEQMLTIQKKLQEKYEQSDFLDNIFVNIEDEMSCNIEDELIEVRLLKNALGNKSSSILKNAISKVINVIMSITKKKMEDLLDGVEFLGRINMLCIVYEQEQRIRRQQEEFEQIMDRQEKILEAMTQSISQTHRTELKQLVTSLGSDEKGVERILQREPQLFNIRECQGKIKISLSPKGKKFNEYVLNRKEEYSYATMNQIVKKNCEVLINGMENSYKSGLIYNIQLQRIGVDEARSIQHKYVNAVQRVIEDKRESYYYDYEDKFVKSRGGDDYGEENRKYTYRISTSR